MALSINDLAEGQTRIANSISAFEKNLPRLLQLVLNRFDYLAAHGQEEQEKMLLAFRGTEALIITAMEQCQTILDADNSILEAIERQLRQGGQ